MTPGARNEEVMGIRTIAAASPFPWRERDRVRGQQPRSRHSALKYGFDLTAPQVQP